MASCKVLIRCMIELQVGVWNDKITMESIRAQASNEGIHLIQSLIQNNGRVIGKPQVVLVTAEDSNESV